MRGVKLISIFIVHLKLLQYVLGKIKKSCQPKQKPKLRKRRSLLKHPRPPKKLHPNPNPSKQRRKKRKRKPHPKPKKNKLLIYVLHHPLLLVLEEVTEMNMTVFLRNPTMVPHFCTPTTILNSLFRPPTIQQLCIAKITTVPTTTPITITITTIEVEFEKY